MCDAERGQDDGGVREEEGVAADPLIRVGMNV